MFKINIDKAIFLFYSLIKAPLYFSIFPYSLKCVNHRLGQVSYYFIFHHIYHYSLLFFDEFLPIKGKIPCWFARDFLYPDMAILIGNSQLVFCLFIFYHLFILLDSFVILFYVRVCISTGTHTATGSSELVFFYIVRKTASQNRL